jgi:hypothetical protein
LASATTYSDGIDVKIPQIRSLSLCSEMFQKYLNLFFFAKFVRNLPYSNEKAILCTISAILSSNKLR